MTDDVVTDERLYQRWHGGDRSAGEALVDRHLNTVSRFFANKVPGNDLEDLVGMTFERCARSLGRFRGDCRFRSYLLSIALNVLRDRLRKRQPDEPLDSACIADLQGSPTSVVARRAEHRLLLAGLRSLPLDYQTALELHFFEGLSRDDAAAALGIPPGTVASRLRRGRELLAENVRRLAASPGQCTATLTDLEDWMEGIRALLRLD